MQVTGLRGTRQPVSRVLFPGASRRSRSATIHLGVPLPTRSSSPPAGSGGPPSNACAHPASRMLSTLLRVGFTEPPRSPGMLVVSYTTVSPLPPIRGPAAVCFLWHCPAARAGLRLATTLPCGARTFLGVRPPGNLAVRPDDAAARLPRPRPMVAVAVQTARRRRMRAAASRSARPDGTSPKIRTSSTHPHPFSRSTSGADPPNWCGLARRHAGDGQ